MSTESAPSLAGLPTAGVVVLAVVAAVQLALQVFCLVDLARRRQVLLDRKWIWLLIILLGQLAGAIVYLAVGRSVEPVSDDASLPKADSGRSRKAVEILYPHEE